MEWWAWLWIAALVVWVFTVKGFSGLGQPNDPPFPHFWPKVRAFLERKLGPFE
jgi:hypothetical protein